MKRHITILMVLLSLGSCSKSLDLENISYPLRRGTEYTDMGGIYLFYPEEGFEINIQGFPARLDGQYQHKADAPGNIVKGQLSEDFTASNSFASFTIPAGTQFQRSPEGTEYFFLLKENNGILHKDDQNAFIYEYLVITGAGDFATIISDQLSFIQDDEEVTYRKDDKVVCSAETGFNIRFFTQSYRDQMEINLLKEMNPLLIEDLERQFAPKEDMPTQAYYGSGFLLHLLAGQYKSVLRPVENETEVLTIIGQVAAEEARVEDYAFILELPMNISVDGNTEKGQLNLLVIERELENVRATLDAQEDIYLLFRMGNFVDGSRQGMGMIYYSYTQAQLDRLLEKSRGNI